MFHWWCPSFSCSGNHFLVRVILRNISFDLRNETKRFSGIKHQKTFNQSIRRLDKKKSSFKMTLFQTYSVSIKSDIKKGSPSIKKHALKFKYHFKETVFFSKYRIWCLCSKAVVCISSCKNDLQKKQQTTKKIEKPFHLVVWLIQRRVLSLCTHAVLEIAFGDRYKSSTNTRLFCRLNRLYKYQSRSSYFFNCVYITKAFLDVK